MVYLFQSLTGISLGYIFKDSGREYSEEISYRDIKFVDDHVNQKTRESN